jgi:transcriptional regulator of aromatic amino acid metabolism
MVFGTDSSQVHWKKVVADGKLQGEFRSVLNVASLTVDQWDEYWRDMTNFRNDYAAHRIVAETYPTTPKMDTALLVATTYDRWIRQRLRESQNAIFEEPSLRERYDRITRTSQKFLKPLVALGPTFDQEYERNVP